MKFVNIFSRLYAVEKSAPCTRNFIATGPPNWQRWSTLHEKMRGSRFLYFLIYSETWRNPSQRHFITGANTMASKSFISSQVNRSRTVLWSVSMDRFVVSF